jgi:DNA-directed RNA polymerase specialized sigma24 family protein
MSCIEFDEELIEPEYTNLPVGEANKLLREEIEAVDNPEHKEVLSLYFTYGFRMKEIDQIVEMKYRNIDLVIQRFRRMLKEKHN